ncbi:MAG: hypothetical protein A2W17_08175 [Planctomycetes bacterium RBG_16_41_13]|nr:MAG: hypothetical protein A2W17_08175 [Planctomycetes bacterium RBG_16_41_13]
MNSKKPILNPSLREGLKTFFSFSFRKKKILVCCFLLFSFPWGRSGWAQQKEIVAISAGAGALTFHGDVGSNSLVGAYSFMRSGYSFSIEKKAGNNFALSLNLLKGKLARDEKSSDNLPKLNFESPITQIGISGTFLMTAKRQKAVTPFFSAGVEFISFDPQGDLKDKYGSNYYYWNDGSIRDLPDSGMNFYYAQTIERDYKYETKLTDSVKYSRTSFALPITGGIKLKLNRALDANFSFAYHFTFTDYLDNVKAEKNDAYLFSSVSLTWHIFMLTKEEQEKFSNIDFVSIDKTDTDKDGIKDVDDLCPNNPISVKVDGKGCPIDSDADGIPDYADKEPRSKGGLPVDVDGVELTKERLAEIQKDNNVKAALHADLFSEQFNKKPSAAFLKEVEDMALELKKNPDYKPSNTAIPYDLRIADWNKDGFIASDEIAKTIDAFFDGTIIFSAEQINRLIDFFFEQ